MTNFCPNCKTEIKSSFLFTNKIIGNLQSQFIREYSENESYEHCDSCSMDLMQQARTNFINFRNDKVSNVASAINQIPIVTIHNPYNWEYQAIGIVSAQSVTGTGVFAEISSGITDFFGMQSEIYNTKLAEGENRCMNMLRSKALTLGANAIIGTDIDYSEAGGLKGMLMVCMAGTAVKLKNLEVLSISPDIFINLDVNSKWIEEAKKYSSLVVGYE